MCLELNPKQTQQVENRLTKKGFIWAYKQVRIRFTEQLSSTKILCGIFETSYNYYPGNNRSNRPRKKLLKKELIKGEVHQGIHVYLKPPKCEHLFPYATLRVRCYAKDFIAAGAGEAVFMQIEIPLEEYNKATTTSA